MLSLEALRTTAATTRALPPGAILPAPISEPQKPGPVALAEHSDETAELLDDFLIALLDLPGDGWSGIAVALPDEIYDRIGRYLEERLSEAAA
jgi:hypothetical protein